MGFWNSVRTAVDRVTGSSANVTLGMDPQFVVPGQTVTVHITIKNGPAPLDVRAVLLEVESIEEIDLPRRADWTSLIANAAAATSRPQSQAQAETLAARHLETMFESKVTVAPGMNLAPGEERNFKGTFRLPSSVQPTYQGKYAKHAWRLRARLDVLGVDPGTGWLFFPVGAPR